MERKIKWLILIIAGLFLFAACSTDEVDPPVEEETEYNTEEAESTNPEIDEDAFLAHAAELHTEVFEFATTLSSVGIAQLAIWEDLEGPHAASSEMIAQHGFDWLETHSGMTRNHAEAKFNQLYAEYTALQNAPITGDEAEEILDELSALFAYFVMMYETVTEPGDLFETFVFNMSTGINGLIVSNDRLEELLSD